MSLTAVIEPAEICLSKNPIILKLHTDVSLSSPNFVIKCTIDIVDHTGEIIVVNLVADPDVNGDVQFDFMELIDGVFDKYPETSYTATLAKSEENKIIYSINAVENYGDPATDDGTYNFNNGVALRGGIAKERFPTFNFISWINQGVDGGPLKFLTWQPDNKIVGLDQFEWLYFYHLNVVVGGFFYLGVYLTYTDGTHDGSSVLLTSGGAAAKEVWRIPCGVTQLGLETFNPTKTIQKYEIRLVQVGTGTAISEVRTYWVDYKYYRNINQYFFVNSLSGIDTLRTTGLTSQTAEHSSQSIQKTLPYNYATVDGESADVSRTEQLTEKLTTGNLSRRWEDFLREFALSKRIYWRYTGPSGGVLNIPCRVSSKKFEYGDSEAQIRSAQFEIQPLYENSVYTPL